MASMLSNAECLEAQAADVPHGANTMIELREQELHYVFGTVLFPRGEPATDIVVEVYRRSGRQSFQEIRQQTRLTACVTTADGKFSFPVLKPGTYLLLLGTRTVAGVNETYVPIILKRGWWRRRGTGLKLTLALGT